MWRNALRATIIALGTIVLLLTPAHALAHRSYVHISLAKHQRVGRIAEIDVHVHWYGAAATTLLVVDGIPGWKTTLFGPYGYESRDFCDEDNPPQRTILGRGKTEWAIGRLWTGAACSARLFLVPNTPGTYAIHARFLLGTGGTILPHYPVNGLETTFRVTVTR